MKPAERWNIQKNQQNKRKEPQTHPAQKCEKEVGEEQISSLV